MKTTVAVCLLSLACVGGLPFAGPLATTADAAGFPTKPITVFNSSTAGSPTDVMARQVAQYARKSLGQPMVVVNKPGGGGGVMFAALFGEPADGYAIASLTASQVAALHAELKKDFSFDDLDFLANVQRESHCLVVKADSPFKTLQDVVEAGKKGSRVKVGGQGTGSALHLMVILFGRAGRRRTRLGAARRRVRIGHQSLGWNGARHQHLAGDGQPVRRGQADAGHRRQRRKAGQPPQGRPHIQRAGL